MAGASGGGGGPPGARGALPRVTRVKNKQPAEQQITAEQILREAHALCEAEYAPPASTIADEAELAAYRLKTRTQHEDTVRRVRWNAGAWAKYAAWEERQGDLRRARSVYERALDVDARNATMWRRYAEMEMRNRAPNHARNVLDRAVTLLPRVDDLWFKYVHMEQVLGNVDGARRVFQRWAAYEPDHSAWAAWVKFELAAGEVANARAVYDAYVRVLPCARSYINYARFEMREAGDVAAARAVYERAAADLGDDADLLCSFAAFEARVGEPDRATAIYKHALATAPPDKKDAVFAAYSAFERGRGDRAGVDAVVAAERRFEYEQRVAADATDYDAWFGYAAVEEDAAKAAAEASASAPDWAATRDVYERAVAALPPRAASPDDKRLWRRYVWLWIYYAVFEELTAKDADRAREVYRAALKVVPHAVFTFAKLWLLAAKLELRCKRLPAARKILGTALGVAPKPKLYAAYIDIELGLGAVDRARTLHTKWVEAFPTAAAAWTRFAELEASLGETDRARALYELAVAQQGLDAPELVWAAYIAFEAGLGERSAARALYERMLEPAATALPVWLSYAAFEAAPLAVGEGAPDGAAEAAAAESPADRETTARRVYERAFAALRSDAPDAKDDAVALLDAWRAFERGCVAVGSVDAEKALADIEKKAPQRVKRKRAAPGGGGMEEYYDFVFPGEAGAGAGAPLKLLEAARRWKKARESDERGGG